MEEPIPLSLKGITWHYKGEGNSNLVISFSDLKLIARLYKTDDNLPKKNQDYGKAMREVLFWKKILIPHLGKHFKPPFLAYVSEGDATHVNTQLRAYRPKHRLNKSIRSGLVTIYPDYTFLSSNSVSLNINSDCYKDILEDCVSRTGSTFCVEIKPKQGWTHPSDRQKKCTFCLNQFLKFESGRVSNISGYCPLDLFSGNKVRMKNALKNLLKNPQNNLKIFQDGHLIFSDTSNCNYEDILKRWFDCDKVENNSRLIDKWTELVYSALTGSVMSSWNDDIFKVSQIENNTEADYNSSPSIFSSLNPCDWTSDQLPSESILNRILLMQKLQDTDFKTVYQHFKLVEHATDNFQYVQNILDNGILELGALERYLLAATAKDCSISIAFNQLTASKTFNPKNSFICDIDGVTYETSIGVLDLDPKPLSCIAKHYNRDLNIHSAYLKYVSKNEPLKNIINKMNLRT